jgi:2-desacetyl-2-hydroxyethyl bacteriochlorophyllide A dehydrogenase
MATGLWFAGPREAELRDEAVAEPGEDEIVVRGLASLISPGTEMLVYRGEAPAEMDLGLETCAGSFGFPVKYAYQIVGEVERAGSASGRAEGDIVFVHHPHQDRFTVTGHAPYTFPVPAGLDPRKASFANLLGVALNSLLDVPVRHGDVVVVYGQGIVGGFCARLARMTAGRLIVVDPLADRRERAAAVGADAVVSPDEAPDAIAELSNGRGADICFEASGAPPALQSAIEAVGMEGTVAVVSFYGTKPVTLTLSPEFHVGRVRVISSQVSTIGSGLQPRWDFERRMGESMRLLAAMDIEPLMTHEFPFAQAAEAYETLDTRPAESLGVVLTYDS